MKKIIKILGLIFILFVISSCYNNDNTNIDIKTPTNLNVDNYILTWDLQEGVKYYEVEMNINNDITYHNVEKSFNFFSYIKGNIEEIIFRVRALSLDTTFTSDSNYSDYFTYKIISKKTILVPTNLDVNDMILTWDLQEGVKYYEVEMIINGYVSNHQVTNYFDFSNYLNSDIEEITFRVKALSLDTTFTSDSNYSSYFTYKNPDFKIEFEKDILNQNFTNANVAPDGWSYNYASSIYADGSLKFSKSGDSITSCSFEAKTTFKVEAKIIGKGAGGDATITIYGLNSKGSVLEKFEITGPISNSTHIIEATFSNTNITKIKFEYTTKATGNFGLFNIYIYHLEAKDIISITPSNLTTNYHIGDSFDYKGSLTIKYSDNTTEVVDLIDLKDELIISNFVNDRFYKGKLIITYKGLSISSAYITSYNYPSLTESSSYTDICVLESIIYINTSDIDVLIVLSSDYDLDKLNSLLEGKSIEYLVGFENIESLNALVFINLNDLDIKTYHLTPTATITYTPNGILFENYKTKVLINTTNDIDDSIRGSYDYIITNNTNYLAPSKNIILNKVLTLGDYQSLSNIYKLNASTSIYDLTDYNIANFRINKYGSSLINNLTEVSSTTFWNEDYKHQDEIYQYKHEEYYESIKNLVGATLKESLAELITSTHTNIVNYDFARTAYVLTDPDFDNPGNIILFYTGESISGVWDNGITWNREHVWPKSLSGGLYPSVDGSSRNAGTDLHQLRPASSSINSSRGNKTYGSVTNNTYFEPNDEFKGDVARIIFYMSIRYNMDIEKLRVAESIDLLLEWHHNDPVDYAEEYRNEQIQKIQGNYNPFIDNPWLADLIY